MRSLVNRFLTTAVAGLISLVNVVLAALLFKAAPLDNRWGTPLDAGFQGLERKQRATVGLTGDPSAKPMAMPKRAGAAAA